MVVNNNSGHQDRVIMLSSTPPFFSISTPRPLLSQECSILQRIDLPSCERLNSRRLFHLLLGVCSDRDNICSYPRSARRIKQPFISHKARYKYAGHYSAAILWEQETIRLYCIDIRSELKVQIRTSWKVVTMNDDHYIAEVFMCIT